MGEVGSVGEAASNRVSDIRSLELCLREELGLPPSGFRQTHHSAAIKGELRHLGQLITELRRRAAVVGQIPRDYPGLVTLVMRTISALLPWYTRPLREFAATTTDALSVLSRLVDALYERQASIEDSQFGEDARPPSLRA